MLKDLIAEKNYTQETRERLLSVVKTMGWAESLLDIISELDTKLAAYSQKNETSEKT